jgi:hypothetical protein
MTGLVCDTPECSAAIARLQAARNRILSLCDRLSQLRASASSFNALAASMLAIAGVMAGLGTAVLPNLIAAIAFWIAAALFAGLAVYFAVRSGIINGQINDVEQEMVAAREEFDKAVTEVMKNCPSECWGVLDQPLCP